MIVVSNTSPLHYLILIGEQGVLPRLYGQVIIPTEVLGELSADRAPAQVKTWLTGRPAWLQMREAPPGPRGAFHLGEAAAIRLALALSANLLLVDDLDARASARAAGLRATGLLGVLRDAAAAGLTDIAAALARLRATNFRASPGLYDQIFGRRTPHRIAPSEPNARSHLNFAAGERCPAAHASHKESCAATAGLPQRAWSPGEPTPDPMLRATHVARPQMHS